MPAASKSHSFLLALPWLNPQVRQTGLAILNQKLFNEVPFAEERRKPVSRRVSSAQLDADRTRDLKAIGRLLRADGGKAGTRLTKVDIRISGTRKEKQVVRCRPGTFEWRYGRRKQDALFHAGSHFAQTWERAGCTVASSVDFLRGTRSGFMTGMAEGRIAAIDNLAGAVEELGRFTFERLMDYCVLGLTTSQIARKHGQGDRDMAAVLHQDLRSCAMHFRFL